MIYGVWAAANRTITVTLVEHDLDNHSLYGVAERELDGFPLDGFALWTDNQGGRNLRETRMGLNTLTVQNWLEN